MKEELNEGTTFKLSIKTLAGIAALIFTLVSMWFVLQGDIAEAKILPANKWNPEWKEKLPAAEVSRMEFDMKDENIRLTIENTATDVEELKEDLDRIEAKIDKLR